MFRLALRTPANCVVRRALSTCTKDKAAAAGTCSSSCEVIKGADSSSMANRVYHAGSLALAVVTPVAFLVPASPLSMPLDVAIAALVPYHSYVAMNYVVSDYVPKGVGRQVARSAVILASLVAFSGLMVLATDGRGVANTVKSLWAKPAEEAK